MFKFTKKKIAAVVAGVAIVGASSGVAFAYWTQSGSGTGTAATGSTQAITINQTSTITGLYPGDLPHTLSGNFTNPNPSKVFVEAVTADSITIDSTHATAGCTPGDYTLGGTAVVHGEIAVGLNVGTWTGLTVQMKDTVLNQDACKGAQLTIAYSSN
jgi:hypothetical protein